MSALLVFNRVYRVEYSQSCWYFRTLLLTSAPLTFSLVHVLIGIPPHSLTPWRVCPPLVPGGHTRLRERGWGERVPIRTMGQTLWYSRYICCEGYRRPGSKQRSFFLHKTLREVKSKSLMASRSISKRKEAC